MTESQKQAFIKMHEKAAKAFKRYGKVKDAEEAERMAEELKDKK